LRTKNQQKHFQKSKTEIVSGPTPNSNSKYVKCEGSIILHHPTILNCKRMRQIDMGEYQLTQEFNNFRKKLFPIFDKYGIFSLCDEYRIEANKIADEIGLNHNVIGVHGRVAFKFRIYSNSNQDHLIHLEKMIEYTKLVLSTYPENVRLYLATCSEDFIDRFKQVFGEKVIFRKVSGLTKGSDDWTKGRNNQNSNNADKDAFIDSLLLSKCNSIIAGPSNLSLYSLFINPFSKLYIPTHLIKTRVR
jgi:hypothetical protein